MKISVLRQRDSESASYWESFDAAVTGDMSVAGVLDFLNYHDNIVNDKGEETGRIAWDCSCLQGLCGACAMVINGQPRLACETFVRDLVGAGAKRGGAKGATGADIEIRPLQKFPVVRDLIVDRSIMQDHLRQAHVYIEEFVAQDGGSERESAREKRRREQEHEHQYAVAKCLKCGLCLEVCPNYSDGSNFFGAAFANDCYLVASRSVEHVERARSEYREHFGSGCSKALSCMGVCPVGIPTIASMAKLNRSGRGRA